MEEPQTDNRSKFDRCCFTLNNYTDEDLLDLQSNEKITYIIYGHEVALTGVPHLQGYIEVKARNKMGWWKKHINGRAHFSKAYGSVADNIRYCSKGLQSHAEYEEFKDRGPNYGKDANVFIRGEPKKKKQGERVDLNGAKKLIMESKSMKEIYLNETITGVVAKYPQWVQTIYIITRPQMPPPDIELRPWQVEVIKILDGPLTKRMIIWIWSHKSGTGKTTFGDFIKSKYRVLCGCHELKRTVHQYDFEQIVYFDLARSDPCDAEMLTQLEQLSNHTTLASSMYTGGQKWIQSHILVTTNRPPPHNKLPDRIKEFALDDPSDLEDINVMGY